MINIVLSSDENFVPYLCVALTSVSINNTEFITFYILENNISEESKLFIKNYEKRFNHITIIFIECSDLENKLKLSKEQIEGFHGINITTYSRLFISKLIPETVDKILYLDCDTITLGSIKELWDMDISNYMCAGSEDPAPIPLKEVIGLNSEDIYINAGVILINLKLWREKNITEDFLKFLSEHYGEYINHDQGVINGVLKNQIMSVHPKYNFMAYFFNDLNPDTVIKWNGCTHYYDRKTMEEARENPVIKHGKPWFAPEDYEKYIKLSEIEYSDVFSITNKKITKTGEFFEKFKENKMGQKFLDIVPGFIAVNLKNHIVRKQLTK